MDLFNIPLLLCAAASSLAFVAIAQGGQCSSQSQQSQQSPVKKLNKNKSKLINRWKGEGGAFQELTDANLREYLDSGNVLFINLHAEEWCGHCQNLKPIWDNFSGDCANLQTIKVLKCDAEKNTECSSFFKVTGYPTIVLYKDGKSTVYEGEKNPKAFCAFLKKHCK